MGYKRYERDTTADILEALGLIAETATNVHAINIRSKEIALDREDRKAAAAQQILLKEYYDKKSTIRQTEDMYNKYSNLNPSDISKGGMDIVNIIDEQNNIDIDAISRNLDTMTNYKSELEVGLNMLQGQSQILKEMQTEFAGANRVLDPHEYEAFQEHALKSLKEGGLGWETTACADVEYFKTYPEARFARALQITDKMKSDEDTGAKGNYAILQSMYALGENEDADDLVERLTYKDASGNEVAPSEDVVAAIQRLALQPNYDEFVANLNALPAEYGGDVIRTELMTNPNTSTLFNNLQGNVKAIDILENELAGINETDSETRLDQFVSDISGVTNEEALFGLYDQAIEGLDPEEHEAFFNAMELQSGTSDLYPAYGEYKGFSGGADIVPQTNIVPVDDQPIAPRGSLVREVSERNQAVLDILNTIVSSGARSSRDKRLEELEESGLPSSGQILYDEIFNQLKE